MHFITEDYHQLSISYRLLAVVTQQTLKHSVFWQAVSETVAVRVPKRT
jgi:hypothetical protein